MSAKELPDHIRALLVSSAYPHGPDKVELIQTHISYVLLAGDEVYKLKKPVNFGFLDFSSLEKRKIACQSEVRLNRRACEEIYLGVEPVVRGDTGFRIGGQGDVVDYAVHMKRLPTNRTMDALIDADAVTLDMIDRLTGRLVSLHAQSADEPGLGDVGGFEALRENWRKNLDLLEPFVGKTLSRRRWARIGAYAARLLRREESVLRRRELDGRVRDCHGDLRSDAICIDESFEGGICLFDCIEFDNRLRISDVGLEIGFLAMDLDFRARPDLADLLVGLYAAATNDQELPRLVTFFKCYRACIRGLVESLTSERAEIDARQRAAARRRAREYFKLAERYSHTPAATGVVLMMGLSGSGKSVLAGCVAARFGVSLLATDLVRQQLFGARLPGVGRDGIGTGRYTAEERDSVYRVLFGQVKTCLAEGRGAVVDGTYIRREQRAPVWDFVSLQKRPLLLVECRAPEAAIEERQGLRRSREWAVSEGRWEVYKAQRAVYEGPDEVPNAQRIVVDTTLPLADQIELVNEAAQRLSLNS